MREGDIFYSKKEDGQYSIGKILKIQGSSDNESGLVYHCLLYDDLNLKPRPGDVPYLSVLNHHVQLDSGNFNQTHEVLCNIPVHQSELSGYDDYVNAKQEPSDRRQPQAHHSQTGSIDMISGSQISPENTLDEKTNTPKRSIIRITIIVVGALFILMSLDTFSKPSRIHYPEATRHIEAAIVKWTVHVAPGTTGFDPFTGSDIGRGGEMLFQISYVFNVNGKEYHGVDDEMTAPSGSKKIDIVYNPEDPSQNEIPKIDFKKIYAWVLLVLGVLSIILSGALSQQQDKDQQLGQ